MFDSWSSGSIDDAVLDCLVREWAAEADAADRSCETDTGLFDDSPPPPPLTRDEADALVAAVLDVGPGLWAASVLVTVSVDDVSEPMRFELVRAWQAQQAWTDAHAALALADHLGPEPAQASADRTVPDAAIGWRMRLAETALALCCSQSALRRRAAVATDLAHRLPMTRQALLAGRLGWYQAMVVAEAVVHLPDPAARQVEARALAGPSTPTPATLRRRLRRAVIQADPAAAVTAARTAYDTREVRRVTGAGAQDCLGVWSDARDIQALWGQLTALAGPADADDPRPLGARRVDALLGLVTGAFQLLPADTAGHRPPGPVPPRPKVPVQLQVVVDLATLAGLADHPGQLPGHGVGSRSCVFRSAECPLLARRVPHAHARGTRLLERRHSAARGCSDPPH